MGQEQHDQTEPPGPAPEPFDEFYLREYPAVVGLLQGLLRSRLVAEELAQETFLVAYRDWGRISGLDNPRAWIRKVALNQRGSFLRAYLRRQAREQRSVVREEYDTIKLAAALGRAPGTIKAQLHQGRRQLARLLGPGHDRGRPT
jgi:DNA-directed RNA polymerase specialized sigma24 family protein